jgi:DNA-binding PadR family transcriptional regulator
MRRVYRATAAGRKALALAREKVKELLGELLEDDSELPGGGHAL